MIKGLEVARGNGTSMISLVMPPKDQVCCCGSCEKARRVCMTEEPAVSLSASVFRLSLNAATHPPHTHAHTNR